MTPRRWTSPMRASWTESKPEIAAFLARPRRWLVASDFDGTLAPIVRHPTEAELLPRARRILREMRKHADVALVSGRALSDLKARVRVEGCSFAGNHGLEITTSQESWQHPEANSLRSVVSAAARALSDVLAGIPGAEVEDKGLTLSVHFRRTPHELTPLVLTAVEAQATASPELRVHSGKSVLELRPPMEWHKGSAILWLAERFQIAPAAIIYLGDDATDEDAFRALSPLGCLTFRVGSGPTSARWQISDVEDACDLLEFVLQSWTELRSLPNPSGLSTPTCHPAP